jgi:hypothetical protein
MPPQIGLHFNEDLLIQAAIEWEASEYKHMPTLDEVAGRNMSWSQQVTGVHQYLEWVRGQKNAQDRARDRDEEAG